MPPPHRSSPTTGSAFGGKAVLVDRAAANAFDVIESKLLVPEVRADTVSRTALVNRLRAAGAFPVVLVVAPAGYGKTTLLAQWAAKDTRSFAWLSVDERDNDPVVLMRHLVAAFDRIEPVDPGIAEVLATPGISVWDAVVPRLTKHLASRSAPFVLVLDDVDLLESEEAIRALTVVIQNIPPGSMIALAGRAQPALPVAALRVDAPLLEIGAYELALSRREAELLLRACAVELADDAIGELVERTEGWATGLYLAAFAVGDRGGRGGTSPDPAEFSGDDRYVADYLESEYLAGIEPELRRFLLRTSVLNKLSVSLCDAVLAETGSAAALDELEKLNLFLVPLDRHREWYRYHQLFRDLLQRQLKTEEPELVPELNARAAKWFEANGDQESALGHAHAAGDGERAARILSSIALEAHDNGRATTVEAWLRRFDEDERLENYPAVAIHGCRIHAVQGRPEEAERWLVAAERGVSAHRKGVGAVRPWIAAMRSGMCADGPKRMRLDAEAARVKLPRGSTWRPSALLFEGAAAILLGEDEKADELLAEAALSSERAGSTESLVVALAERSLLAAAREDHESAETLALQACGVVEQNQLDDYATSSLAIVASGRALLRHGLWDKARHQLDLAERVLPGLTYVLPWLAVQVRVELGLAYVTLRDRDAAQRMLVEAREILAVKPKLGVVAADVDGLADEIATMPAPVNGRSSGLTSAELRLLPLLATHLSFREIGERLFVSRNTIKTQAISVYRKLGVSSRSEAIERAVELGLVEAEDQLARRRPPNGVSAIAS